MRNILFRTDSSRKIGTGHIMRDLVLANQYKKDKVVFACQDLENNINYKITNAGYELELLESNDIDKLIDLIHKYKFDLIVIDHYEIDYKYEKLLKEKTGIEIFVIGDTYEKHHCDILLNHNIGAEASRYRDLLPVDAEIRCGVEYSLIREEFKIEKKRNKTKVGSSKNVMIAIGGTDILNINLDILEVLKKFKNLKADIVTTTSNQNIDELKSYIDNNNNFNLHINTNKMAKLMNQCDLVITTPSVTINEVYYMKIPFIAIKVADNQKDIYEYLFKNNFSVMESFSDEILYKLLIENIGGIENV